jgi:hypothetical protein
MYVCKASNLCGMADTFYPSDIFVSASHCLDPVTEKRAAFIPHGHCYAWIPSHLWLHLVSDVLIGTAYVSIFLLLHLPVKKIRALFSSILLPSVSSSVYAASRIS